MTTEIFQPLEWAPLSKRWQAAALRYSVPVSVYILATLATKAYWMGDTVDYVESITWFARGVDHYMWDFAHLLWRPLGWILFAAFQPITALFVGDSDRLQVMLTLSAVSWISGLVCVICVHSLAGRVSGRIWIANAVSVAFVFTQVFLNWSQAGSAYVPGLALLLVGLNLLIDERPLFAGIAIAGAVCLWVPYLLAVPAVLLAPIFLSGFTRERIRTAAVAAIISGLLTAIVYLAVIAGLQLHTIDEVKAWIASSGHGIDYSGAKRMVFGFARSFINMGNDGLLFKRYLLKDPFNPVSFSQLIGTTLFKLGLVYVFIGSLLMTMRRRMLALFLINAIPVLGLAYFFASSEPERYIPLFPMLFIAIASCLRQPSRVFRGVAFGFIAVVIATNSAAMARPVLDGKQEAVVSRVRDLFPRLDERAIVFTATYQDDLMTFSRTYPFHPLNRSDRFRVSPLLSPGTSWNVHWCEDFASRVLSTWKTGGATWISVRALSHHPRSEWNWAEGDDRRVSWRDFPLLCSHLELGESVGGADGFVQILPSRRNQQFLSTLTTAALVAERQHK